jgi:single-stranded-DNA-specific exonuclease
LEEVIKNLGGKDITIFFPDRENDGYGLNLKALDNLKNKAPGLLITLDLGIGNVEEIEVAKKIGFEVLIVDHHEILTRVPDTKIIVDPKQKDDSFAFKGLANVGITYKLALEILGENISENLKNSFLELTALGTIADMVPQENENKYFIEQGLRSLKNTFRPGLRAFLDILGEGEVFGGGLLKFISALNSAESLGFENETHFLLTCSDSGKCRKIAEDLIVKTNLKQQKIKEAVEEIERRVSAEPEGPIIFEGDIAWKLTMAGAVASIVSQKFNKPAFIFKKMSTESCGSVRNPEGTDSVDAMKTCSNLLITFGGHQRASGFRVKNENLDEFKQCLCAYFTK